MRYTLYAIMASLALTTAAPAAQTAIETTITPSETVALTNMQLQISDRLELLAKGTKADRRRSKEIHQWYEDRSYQPIWTTNGQPSNEAQEVIFSLMSAYEQGLIAADYEAEKLFGKLSANSENAVADFEVSLSLAAVTFGQHLYSDRVEPTKINREVMLYPDDISAGSILDKLAKSKTPKQTLSALSPNTARYDRMRSLLL